MRIWTTRGHSLAKAADRILVGSSYLYLVIPIVIFLFGWLRPPLALVVSSGLLLGTWKTIAGFGYREDHPPRAARFLVLAALIAAGWVLLSGIDTFGFQNPDFRARNTIFRDLIERPWPVLYDYRGFPVLQGAFGDTGALVYYFLFWLPCALVGKLLGWEAANHALLAWSMLGVFLSIMLIGRFIGTHSISIILAFICWSGMDIVGSLLYNPPSSVAAALAGDGLHLRHVIGQVLWMLFGQQQLEGWVSTNTPISLWQYSSFTTQLFWVFNQAIPAWLVTALLMSQQDKKGYVFTFSLAILFAPLPAVGLLPFLVRRLAENWKPRGAPNYRGAFGSLLSQTISFQNTVAPALLAFVAAAFLGTRAATPMQGFVWEFLPLSAELAARYLAFCILEFLAFGLLVLRRNKDGPVLVLAILVLLALPLYVYGRFNDLVMRGSIPALPILFMIGIRNLVQDAPRPTFASRLSRTLLAVVLLTGAITPLHEIGRSTQAIVESEGAPSADDIWPTLGGYPDITEIPDEFPNFVLAEPEATFFFRVLAR